MGAKETTEKRCHQSRWVYQTIVWRYAELARDCRQNAVCVMRTRNRIVKKRQSHLSAPWGTYGKELGVEHGSEMGVPTLPNCKVRA